MGNPTFKDGSIARRKQPGVALTDKDSATVVEPYGIHNSTPPTLADGDVANQQLDDLGNLKVSMGDPAQSALLSSPTNIEDGSVTLDNGGTRQTLVGSSTPCRKVWLSPKDSNVGEIRIGGSGLTVNTGKQLYQGEDFEFEIDDLQKVYFISATTGDVLTFMYVS